MKKFSIFVFCGMLAASGVQAEMTVTTTTTTAFPPASEKVVITTTSAPTIVTYSSSGKVSVNQQGSENELYHRQQEDPRFDNSPILAVGAGAAASALIWDSGYRHGRRHRYRRHRYYW